MFQRENRTSQVDENEGIKQETTDESIKQEPHK